LLRRRLAVVLATAMMLAMMVAAGPAFGDHVKEHPFCGSGEEYAHGHIKPLAQDQGLGPAHGHTPCHHKGFSVCDPSGHAGSEE
jgi:hypothetical protein